MDLPNLWNNFWTWKLLHTLIDYCKTAVLWTDEPVCTQDIKMDSSFLARSCIRNNEPWVKPLIITASWPACWSGTLHYRFQL